MERVRKPFQGIVNVFRFNWHYYIISIGFIILVLFFLNKEPKFYVIIICVLLAAPIVTSLVATHYIYDLSGLYKFEWLGSAGLNCQGTIVNINAGFDETSSLLKSKYSESDLHVFDFYEHTKHTEVSIKRARKISSIYPGTQKANTANFPLQDNYVDIVFLILSAHEIRNEIERIIFFKEMKRIIKKTGKIVVTEHLRDLPNFLVYNFGFLHFHSPSCWHRTFNLSKLKICKEIKITPFITTFILEKNGSPP